MFGCSILTRYQTSRRTAFKDFGKILFRDLLNMEVEIRDHVNLSKRSEDQKFGFYKYLNNPSYTIQTTALACYQKRHFSFFKWFSISRYSKEKKMIPEKIPKNSWKFRGRNWKDTSTDHPFFIFVMYLNELSLVCLLNFRKNACTAGGHFPCCHWVTEYEGAFFFFSRLVN